jgi:DNA-binding transcriptional regulator YbjK
VQLRLWFASVATAARDSKREQIVAAAAEVLLTQGVEACTVRSIAATGAVSKSQIHYYFDDVNDIITLAFESLMNQFVSRVEHAAYAVDDPYAAVWAAAAEYLRVGADVPGGQRVPMLSFEYQIVSTRRGDNSTLTRLAEQFVALLEGLVEKTGVSHPAAVADTLFSALIGSVVRAPLTERDVSEVLATISTTIGLPLSQSD